MPPRPYTVEVSLRWSDMDAYGHVNNAAFLTILEEARVLGFQEWFAGTEMLQRGVVVVRHEIDYMRPLVHRLDSVAVDMWVTELARASFDLAYEVRDPDRVGGQRYARAETTMATVDLASSTSRPLDPAEAAVLETKRDRPPPLRSRMRRGAR